MQANEAALTADEQREREFLIGWLKSGRDFCDLSVHPVRNHLPILAVANGADHGRGGSLPEGIDERIDRRFDARLQRLLADLLGKVRVVEVHARIIAQMSSTVKGYLPFSVVLRTADGPPFTVDEVSLLRVAVETFRMRSRDRRSPALVRHELLGLRQVVDTLLLEFSTVATEFAECGEDEWQGCPSPVDWIKEECHTTGTAAWDALVAGRQAPRLTGTTDALQKGQVGFSHLTLIARTAQWAEESGVTEAFDEARLLRRARSGSFAELRRETEHLRHALDPRRFLREQRLQREERFLELTGTEGGGVWVRGYLDGEGGATLRSALEPLATPLRDDQRSRERRLADALVDLSAAALDAGALPQHAGERPHLQITVSLPTLQGTEGSPAAELEQGGTVAAETARRLACDAQVRRVIFGPQSQVLDVGRAARVPHAATRRAVLARDQGCVWPGCHRPPSWGEVHHHRHWADGGTTDLSNLYVLCRAHHFRVHEAGWRLVRTDGGMVALPPIPADLGPRLGQARAPDPPDAV
jgi:hypothetical protein